MRRGMKAASRENVRRDKLKFRSICAGGFAILILLAAFILTQINIAPVGEIALIGNKHLKKSEIEDLMGAGEGDNMLGLRSGRLAEGLLRSPWVKSASIRKEYPGRLLVKISEAEPAALMNSSGKIFIVDEEGRKLEELRGEAVPFLPVINASNPANPDTLKAALALVSALREAGLSSKQVEITGVEGEKKDIVISVEGTQVRVGDGPYSEKLARFAELEEEIKKKWAKVEYVDLRFANRVVVRPLKEELK